MEKIVNEKEYKDKFNEQYQTSFDTLKSELFLPAQQVGKNVESFGGKKYSYWKNVFKKLYTSWIFIASVVVILVVIITAFAAAGNAEAVPIATERPGLGPANPGWYSPIYGGDPQLYLFGFGNLGEDYFVETSVGTKWTLLFVLAVVGFQLVVGLTLGAIWGFFKKSDLFFINVTNVINLIPSLVFILLSINMAGIGFWPVILAISLQSWIGYAAATRVQIMLIRNREYNVMSRVLGTNPFKMIVRNILPKIAPVIVSIGAFVIPDAISLDTSLSYLKFGFVDGTTTTSLGYLIQATITHTTWLQYPGLLLFPIMIVFVISFFAFLICYKFANALNPNAHN